MEYNTSQKQNIVYYSFHVQFYLFSDNIIQVIELKHETLLFYTAQIVRRPCSRVVLSICKTVNQIAFPRSAAYALLTAVQAHKCFDLIASRPAAIQNS